MSCVNLSIIQFFCVVGNLLVSFASLGKLEFSFFAPRAIHLFYQPFLANCNSVYLPPGQFTCFISLVGQSLFAQLGKL